jgi:hypothetical protein
MPLTSGKGNGLTPLDRFPIEDVRLRRALGRLGILLDEPSGLTLTFSGLSVDPVAPITVGVTGVGLDFGAGLQLSNTTLVAKVQDPIFTDTSGIGLHYGNGLTITASNLVANLAATNPGLQFVSGGLAVLLKADTGLAVDANGLYVKLKTSGGLSVDTNGLYVTGLATFVPYTGATGAVDLGVNTLTTTGVVTAANFQVSTAPTTNSTGTVMIVAKDANLLTANTGWLQFKRSDGTIVYTPYWL